MTDAKHEAPAEGAGEVAAWQTGRDAPAYRKGEVVSYKDRRFEARQDVRPGASTNAPDYSGMWREVK